MRAAIENVRLSTDIVDYIVDIVRATREHPALQYGASPRAANMLAIVGPRVRGAAAAATTSSPTTSRCWRRRRLRHRLVLAPGAEIEGLDADKIVGADPRAGAGAAMIRPTLRAVVLFGAGVPVALLARADRRASVADRR